MQVAPPSRLESAFLWLANWLVENCLNRDEGESPLPMQVDMSHDHQECEHSTPFNRTRALMILSVEHKHPTARKRFRSLHAGGPRIITTCGCEACMLFAEEEGVQMIWEPTSGNEAQIEDPTSFCAVCVSSRERAWET